MNYKEEFLKSINKIAEKEIYKVNINQQYLEVLESQDKEIERLNNIINKAINILELSAMNKGICTRPETDTIQSALLVLKGSDKVE